MRTAIDTKVLSPLWSNKATASLVEKQLGEARNEGGLVIAAPVYAELLAHPKATESFVNGFLADTGIVADFKLEQRAWTEAGRRFARYGNRRRRSAGQEPRRLLTVFLIRSHALAEPDRLMTLDPKRYRRDFPDLELI